MEEPMTSEPAGERTIRGSEFKVKSLEFMGEVAASGQELVITEDGHPVLPLVPYQTRPETLFGIDRGRYVIVGDVGDPVDVEWEAATGAEIVIAKDGRESSRRVPAKESVPRMGGLHRDQVRIVDDIISPAIPAGGWEALGDSDKQ